MAEVEKEFFREGVPHNNQSWMTVVFDTDRGEINIRRYRTSSGGTTIDFEQDPLAVFLATSKSTKAGRALQAWLHRISVAIKNA